MNVPIDPPGSGSERVIGREPEAFTQAVQQLRSVRVRPEISLTETPAPARLAPYSLAINADVILPHDPDAELASGRFVLLHDPHGSEAWGGTFRAVTFVKAELEPEMTGDPLLTAVGWSWVLDALTEHDADYLMPSGTVTRVASESFGELDRDPSAEIEIRASWTPRGDMRDHFEAWCDLLTTCAGLPPLPPGVAKLSSRL